MIFLDICDSAPAEVAHHRAEGSTMEISVNCLKPKSAAGEHTFTSFGELYWWMAGIKALALGALSNCLFVLAKDGRINSFTPSRGIEIDMQSSFRDYYLAREVAFTTGFLRMRGFGERVNRSRDAALEFAKEIDVRAVQTSQNNPPNRRLEISGLRKPDEGI